MFSYVLHTYVFFLYLSDSFWNRTPIPSCVRTWFMVCGFFSLRTRVLSIHPREMVKIRHGFIFIDLVSVGSRHCHTNNTIFVVFINKGYFKKRKGQVGVKIFVYLMVACSRDGNIISSC